MSDTPATRQETLAARLGCYYAGPGRGADRPHCEGAGVVAYGNIVLCASCNKMRSAVGRTEVARPLPGAELRDLIDAAAALSCAEERLGRSVKRARAGGASWSQVGEALGISRQAAQQRFTLDRTRGSSVPGKRQGGVIE